MFYVATSNAIHSERTWSSTQRIGNMDHFFVGTSPQSHFRKYSRHGRFHDCPTGFNESMNRWAKRNWTPFAPASTAVVHLVMSSGQMRLRKSTDSGSRCVRWDAPARSGRQQNEGPPCQYYPRPIFFPVPFSSPRFFECPNGDPAKTAEDSPIWGKVPTRPKLNPLS